MTISFLDNNIGSTFFSLLDLTEKQIRIISPFIGFQTAKALVNFIEEHADEVSITLITRFDREDFLNGASSLAALDLLHKVGVHIYALQRLHTKLYIFDEKSVIMGSANFTFSGFFRNHEFSVFMDNEPLFAGECNQYFDKLFCDIQATGDWKLTQSKLDEEKKQCDKLTANIAASQKKPKKNEFPVTITRNMVQWGAKIELPDNQMINTTSESANDLLEESIQEQVTYQVDNRNTGIWLKFEGSSTTRANNELTYFSRKDKQHRSRTFFPKPPSGIRAGQLLFMSIVSTDSQNESTPMIVGYAISSGYDKSNVISAGDGERRRYPYFVDLIEGRILNSAIKNGISLRELARELKGALYPVPKADYNAILSTHRQKSHLQITPMASDFIMQKLETLFQVHGFEDL